MSLPLQGKRISSGRWIPIEMWVHAAGCRKFFYIARDTVTYQIHATYRVGETYDEASDTVVGRGES